MVSYFFKFHDGIKGYGNWYYRGYMPQLWNCLLYTSTPGLVMDKKYMMDDMGIELNLHEYHGTHKVDEATLKNWVAQHLTNQV